MDIGFDMRPANTKKIHENDGNELENVLILDNTTPLYPQEEVISDIPYQ